MRAGLGGSERSITTERVSRGPAVLVYEPNLIQRKLIEVVMRDLALRVFQVESVGEAEQLIAVEPMDVVLVDVDSGVRAGDTETRMEFIERVVAVGTPVIIVTGAAVHGELDQVRRLGATAVLTKPYQPTVLRDAVDIATRTVAGPRDEAEKDSVRPHRAGAKSGVSSAFVSRVRSALERGRDEGGTGHDDVQDRLGISEDSFKVEPPRATDDVGGSTDVMTFLPGRLNRVTLGWGVVGMATTAAVVKRGIGDQHIVPLAVIATVIVMLTMWNSISPGRVAYDPALPLKAALGIAAGPVGAPIILVGQAVISAVANSIATRAAWRTTVANVGVISLEGVLLGSGIAIAMEMLVDPSPVSAAEMLVAMAVVMAVTIYVNYRTVALTLAYLTGKQSPVTTELKIQFGYDFAAGSVIATLMWAIADPEMIALASVGGFVVLGVVRLRAVVRFQSDAFENLAAVVEEFERRSAPLPDHSANVVNIVVAMTGRWAKTEQQRAVAAAWFHTLSLGGDTDRCSGGPVPEVLEQVRHLPRRWRIEANVAAAAEKRHWTAAESLDVPGLVGLACAVDSLRLTDGQLRTLRDIQLVWGFPARALYDAAFMATGHGENPDGGGRWSPSFRPRPA